MLCRGEGGVKVVAFYLFKLGEKSVVHCPWNFLLQFMPWTSRHLFCAIFKKPYDLPVDSSAEGYFLILVLDENQTNSSINPVTQLSLERNLFLKWISSIFCTGN
jgi:hypothetical protein